MKIERERRESEWNEEEGSEVGDGEKEEKQGD